MAESLDDLNLPTAIIQRLIKESLPKEDSKISVSKDVKLAVSKAASLFILHLTTEALSIANDQKRKTLNGTDVISGVIQCGFESFAIPLQEKLNGLTSKKKVSAKKDTSKNVSNIEEMEVEEADNEEEAEEEEEEKDDE